MDNKKKLGFLNIYSLGVGGAIGSGIFVMMGIGIGYTGRSIFLAVGIGCLYMLLAYLYQPIMASMFTLPGGDYDMKAMLFNPLLTGVGALFAYIFGLGIAAYGTAAVQYASMIFPSLAPYTKLIAFLVITIFFAASIKGSKFLSNITSGMTIILLVSMGLFVLFGLPKVQSDFFAKETFFLNGGTGFIQAISIMAFACQGTTMTPVSMMQDTKNPRRTIPLAIIPITLTVAIVYALMGVVASGVLPVEQVAWQSLAVVSETVFPRWLYVVFILGGAVFAICTSLVSSILMQQWPCLKVAEDGWLPAVFTKKSKGGYPYVVMGLFYLLSVLPVLLDFSLDAIISICMVPMMLMNVYLNIALIGLVKKYPEQWKKSVFHMPDLIFWILCIAGTACAAIVAYTLFTGLAVAEMIFCLVMMGILVGISAFRLMTGAVKKEDLLAKREEIAARAVAATKED